MGTTAFVGQFADPFNGIQIRTVRWQKIKGKAVGTFFPVLLMQCGMMVSSVVRNHINFFAGMGTGSSQLLEKTPEGIDIELVLFPPVNELAVAQADGTKISNTFAGRLVQDDGIGVLRGDPHSTTRTVLLEMDFVWCP